MTVTADGRPGRRPTDDDVLAAACRAEAAEAAHGLTRMRLTNTQIELAVVERDRDEQALIVAGIRDFYHAWVATKDDEIRPTVLLEILRRLLGERP